jgi:pentatricopeptide repeat protein
MHRRRGAGYHTPRTTDPSSPAPSLFPPPPQKGLDPEVRTFNTAIIACNMCGQPQEALKVYGRLLEAGLAPISTTYTALISAYAKGGQLDRALDTFKQMVRALEGGEGADDRLRRDVDTLQAPGGQRQAAEAHLSYLHPLPSTHPKNPPQKPTPPPHP